MTPHMDGLTVLKTLRAQGDDTHILILSAQDRLEDRLQGLDLGADDYLVKPFAFEERCSRLRALMRRRYHAKAPVVCLDGLVLDTAQWRACLDEEQGLSIRLSLQATAKRGSPATPQLFRYPKAVSPACGQRPRRVGICRARSRALRNRERGHSCAPKRSRCSV